MKSIFTLACLLLLAVISVGQLQAQSSKSLTNEDALQKLIPIQIVESLQSQRQMVRSQTLKNVICYSTLHRNRVYLGAVVSAIAEVAQNDASGANRRLAVAALRAIDTNRARGYVAKLGGIDNAEYHQLVAGVLNEYQVANRSASQL